MNHAALTRAYTTQVLPLYSCPPARFRYPNPIFLSTSLLAAKYDKHLRTVSLLLGLFFFFFLVILVTYSFCLCRTSVTENLAIDGRNLKYSITLRNGKTIPILENCSIQIPSGQLWMLLGPNGCGKSTLLKAQQDSRLFFFFWCLLIM